MTDLNEKLDSAAELNEEDLKSVAGGCRSTPYGCVKCGHGIYAEEIETDALGKRRHKGCGGLITGPSE